MVTNFTLRDAERAMTVLAKIIDEDGWFSERTSRLSIGENCSVLLTPEEKRTVLKIANHIGAKLW